MEGATVQVNGQDKAITIKDNSYTLLDNDGNEATSTPAYAADGTTKIGTYSIDPATGQVTLLHQTSHTLALLFQPRFKLKVLTVML